MSAALACNNLVHKRPGYAVHFANFLKRITEPSPHKKLSGLLVRQFSGGMPFPLANPSPVSVLRLGVFRTAKPTQVTRIVVRPNTIDMIDSGIRKMAVDKRKSDQAMDIDPVCLALPFKGNAWVACIRGQIGLQQSAPSKLRWLPFARGWREIVQSSNIALVRNLKPLFVTGGGLPCFLCHGHSLVVTQKGCKENRHY